MGDAGWRCRRNLCPAGRHGQCLLGVGHSATGAHDVGGGKNFGQLWSPWLRQARWPRRTSTIPFPSFTSWALGRFLPALRPLEATAGVVAVPMGHEFLKVAHGCIDAWFLNSVFSDPPECAMVRVSSRAFGV